MVSPSHHNARATRLLCLMLAVVGIYGVNASSFGAQQGEAATVHCERQLLAKPKHARHLNSFRFISQAPIEQLVEITQRWAKPRATDQDSTLFTNELRDSSSKLTHWALLLDHSQSNLKSRRWRVDFALTKISATETAVSMQVHYYDSKPNTLPFHTIPGLIRNVLSAAPARSGILPLSDQPISISNSDGPSLRLALTDPERMVPIVYITKTLNTRKFMVDPIKLAERLQGSAIVMYSEDPLAVDALQAHVPKDLLVWNGAIRIYKIGLEINNPDDFERHRYAKVEVLDLENDPIEAVIRNTQLAIAQSSRRGIEVHTVLDLENMERQALLEESREQVAQAQAHVQAQVQAQAVEPEAEIEIEIDVDVDAEFETEATAVVLVQAEPSVTTQAPDLIQTYQSMLELMEDELRTIRAELSRTQDQVAFTQLERDDAIERVTRLQQHNNVLSASLSAAGTRRSNSSNPPAVAAPYTSTMIVNHLAQLPTTVPEVVRTAAALFPDRLFFTAKAHKSAKDADYDNVNQVWRAFIAMANELHKIYFESPSTSHYVEQEFQARTGLGLALTESGATRDVKRLMRLREDEYDGHTIVAEAHVKVGSGQQAFRIHYWVDTVRQLIVITHAGNHLETAGTRRM